MLYFHYPSRHDFINVRLASFIYCFHRFDQFYYTIIMT